MGKILSKIRIPWSKSLFPTMGTSGYFEIHISTLKYFWILWGISDTLRYFWYFEVPLSTFRYFLVLWCTTRYFWILLGIWGTLRYFLVLWDTLWHFWVLWGTSGYFEVGLLLALWGFEVNMKYILKIFLGHLGDIRKLCCKRDSLVVQDVQYLLSISI